MPKKAKASPPEFPTSGQAAVYKYLFEYKWQEAHDADRVLDDGVYDISGIPFLEVGDRSHIPSLAPQIEAFIREHPGVMVADPANVDFIILLASDPPEYTGVAISPGFNYGTASILTELPSALLILAEND